VTDAWTIIGVGGWLMSAYWWRESRRSSPINIIADRPVPIDVKQDKSGGTTIHIKNGPTND
jgi:hypothetical protein